MGRPKGSKNKPKTFTEGISAPVQPIQETPKKRGRKKKEPEVIIGVDLASGPDMSAHVAPPIKDKEEPEEAPKEDKITSKNTSESIPETKPNKDTSDSKTASRTKKNNKVSYPLCDCCKQEIYCQPHRIDTNILTAQIADYFRETPRWVQLCGECAKKLSNVVDNWLRENGCLTKFEIKAQEQQRDVENSGRYIPDEEFFAQSQEEVEQNEVKQEVEDKNTIKNLDLDDDW